MLLLEPDEQLIAQLCEHQPEAIGWFVPVWEEGLPGMKKVADFEVSYCNAACRNRVGFSKEEARGKRIVKDGFPDPSVKTHLCWQCMQVLETGEPLEYAYLSNHFKRYFTLSLVKVSGGVLVTSRDQTAEYHATRERQQREKEKQQQLRDFSNIINTSADGIITLSSIRDQQGQLVDFRIIQCNTAAHTIGNLPPDALGRTLLDVLPQLKETGYFDLHKQVVETGVTFSAELPFNPGNATEGWYKVTLTKLEDGLVSNFVDITRIKQLEQQAMQNANQLEAIFNASMNGVYALQVVYGTGGEVADLQFLRVNQRFLEIFNLSEDEIIGKSLLAISPETAETNFLSDASRVMQQGTPLKSEVYYEHNRKWYEYCMARLDDDQLTVTVNDITANKQSMLEIEQQKSLLDNILKYSMSGISVTEVIRDAEGRVFDATTLLANDAAVRYTGLPKELYLSKTALEIDPGIIHTPYYQECLKTLETGEPFVIRYLLEPTGRWLEISVTRMDADHLVHIFTDVTASRETQLQVERAAEKLNTIINTSQAGFFLGKPERDEQGEIVDFRFTMVNNVLASFVDKTPDGLVGELGSDWFVQYKNNGLFDHFRNTYLTGNKDQFDFHYLGETVEVWANIMLTKLGEEVLGTFTDFTPVKRLQLQLETMVTELKRSNANLEEFAYIASHDLQEPLRKIRLLSERLQSKLAITPGDEIHSMLERMNEATTRMKALISDLLMYSQVSVKPEVFEPVDLNSVVHQVLQDLEAPISESGAVVHAVRLPTISGDDRQLRQLFQNLISNALKYCKEDTTPRVSITSRMVKGADAPFNMLPEEAKATFCLVEVSDNGIGFEQEYAEKIFQVFHRLHGRSRYAGTGVGLAIVKKVVTNHKGYISAGSEPGRGATFRVLLPA